MLVGSALLLGCNSSNDDPATVPDTGTETPTPEPDTGVIALTDLDIRDRA